MLRQRENSISLKAGALSVGVHGALLIMLLISFNWKTTHPVRVSDVELWDQLPSVATPKPQPTPEPAEVLKPLESKPIVKPEVNPELVPQAEIVIKKNPEKTVKAKPVEVKKADALAALQKELMQEEIKKPTKPASNDALKQLQQEALNEDKAIGDQKKLADKAAVNAGEIETFTNKIRAKIRGNVNKILCGEGNPELKFEIGLLPTGELSTQPKLLKSSGNSACDDAVERAIIASEPLPLPADTALFAQFRSLKLTFRPNDS